MSQQTLVGISENYGGRFWGKCTIVISGWFIHFIRKRFVEFNLNSAELLCLDTQNLK